MCASFSQFMCEFIESFTQYKKMWSALHCESLLSLCMPLFICLLLKMQNALQLNCKHSSLVLLMSGLLHWVLQIITLFIPLQTRSICRYFSNCNSLGYFLTIFTRQSHLNKVIFTYKRNQEERFYGQEILKGKSS